jgi:Domain of unknown function (DUF3303)
LDNAGGTVRDRVVGRKRPESLSVGESGSQSVDFSRLNPACRGALRKPSHMLQRGSPMLFMVVEHFKDGDPVPVYRRFREQGRLAPPAVKYVGSWVSSDLKTCFQVMEAPGRSSLDQWLARWEDLVDFEVVQVITSAEAVATIGPSI